tara:strand:- start:90660 stop:91316 length:657 start_codon:yes stop_codon:yes gene_type:complete
MFDEYNLKSRKKICWKSWNAIVDEQIGTEELLLEELQNELGEMQETGEMQILPFAGLIDQQPKILHTPMGMYHLDSPFKPSDRWDCWLGSTNFDVTHGVKETLSKVKGVEALKILGRYSFFIGIARLFSFKEVRLDIEKKLCGYTEKELLSDEQTQATVNLIKEQLESTKYWSILVAPTGKVDYIVSDHLDQAYLDGLNELLETKQKLGGIILRGDHG